MSYNVKVLKNSSFKDHRGYYWTSWRLDSNKKLKFNHDKFSLSRKNVLRGLHGDNKTWKLISCPYGSFKLIIVNCIKKSRNYLKWKSIILSQKNGLQVLVPPNFANGHLCLSKECLFHYKLSYKGQYLDADKQFSLRWNDPKININWGIKRPILSSRDKKAKLL